jgi:hypothetical protein
MRFQTDVKSHPPLSHHICTSIHTQGKSCSDLGRVLLLNYPPARAGGSLKTGTRPTLNLLLLFRIIRAYMRVLRCRAIHVNPYPCQRGPGVVCDAAAAERGHQTKSSAEERRCRLSASCVNGIPRRLSLSQGVRRDLTADVGVHGMT